MDLIDVYMEYNINKDDPLSATYDMNDEYLKDGTVAFWPNGSWAADVSGLQIMLESCHIPWIQRTMLIPTIWLVAQQKC